MPPHAAGLPKLRRTLETRSRKAGPPQGQRAASANADSGLRIALENSVADQLPIQRIPQFPASDDRRCRTFLLRRVTKRSSKGMDITEYVKRNNFAVAQYEPKPCCTAQNRLLSRDTRWSRPCCAGHDACFEALSRSSARESLQAESPRSRQIRESGPVQIGRWHKGVLLGLPTRLAWKRSPQSSRHAEVYYLPSYP